MEKFKDFDKWVSDHKDIRMEVTKMRDRNSPEMGKGRSGIIKGESFRGQVSLRYFGEDESDYGPGFILLVNGGYTMRTSMVREVSRKGPSRWLLKTMNSIYRVEAVAE